MEFFNQIFSQETLDIIFLIGFYLYTKKMYEWEHERKAVEIAKKTYNKIKREEELIRQIRHNKY